MNKLDLVGNILTMKCETWPEVIRLLAQAPMAQVSITHEKAADGIPEHFLVSRPLAEWERGAYSFLYKRKESGSLNPDGGDDGPRAA